MVAINSIVGITVMLSFIALIGVIGIAIHVEKVLNRCKLFVDFAFFIAAREDEQRTLGCLDKEEKADA